MDEQLRRRLHEAAGVPVSDSGAVAPRGVDEVVAVVRLCAAEGLHISVTSGTGSDAGAAGVAISLHRLDSVEVAPGALTLRAGAGASVAMVRERAAAAGLAVVGLPAVASAERAGALVARGEVPRRALSGIDAVLSTGETVTFGGAVLKDVVGYDLPALLLGSMGRLAVITTVTFRLEPAAARTPVGPPPGAASEGARALVRPAFDPQGLLQPAP